MVKMINLSKVILFDSDVNTKARRIALMDVLPQTTLLFCLFYLALALRPILMEWETKLIHTRVAHN